MPLSDTPPEVLAEHARLVAALSPEQRWQRVRDLNAAANTMALAGLRSRHPEASERELLLRLAVLRLGADLVEVVYGWRAADGA
jgi:hypothetical protein